jgi:O-antigen ligase
MTPPSRLRSLAPFFPSLRTAGLAPAIVGGWAAAITMAPNNTIKLLLAAPVPLGTAAWWILLEPERWLYVLFFSLILLPPLPIALGNSGVHLAPLILIPGLASGFFRSREWRRCSGTLHILFLLFLAIAFGSTALALLYSGASVAAGSLARVFLLAIGVYVYLFTLIGPRRIHSDPFIAARWLYYCAMLGALFACIDFYFQLPAPAGFAAQFVWLGSGIYRRAQGLFYEASILGNFCAFFLVMTLVTAFRPSHERHHSRLTLATGFILFAGALIFSFSRASALNLVVAACAFLYVRRVPVRRVLITTAIFGIAAALVLRFALPEFFAHYFIRIAATFEFFQQAPDRILSGRISMWGTIVSFLTSHPLDAILGIGYKTLPYSHYAGEGLVADNTWLSLLVETGLVGLVVFLFLNAAILRTALRAARSTRNSASFFGAWIFCFWCGELVQMMSGDLITYWRVLPLYFWVLATAAREAAE